MSKTHFVYGLVCPVEGKVFYVGMTTNPRNRLYNHKNDSGCAPYEHCQILKERGLEPQMILFGYFDEKEKARHLEARLTLAIPDLCNRKHKAMPLRYPLDWLNLETPCY